MATTSNVKLTGEHVRRDGDAANASDDDYSSVSTMASYDELPPLSHDLLKTTLSAVVSRLDGSVTIAQPKQQSLAEPKFVALTSEFSELTGYSSEALMKSSLRVLSDNAIDVCLQDNESLRRSASQGSPTTVLKVYRKRSGELFRVLLHLRGLRVGINQDKCPSSAESCIWFAVGLYEDVSDVSDSDIDERRERICEVAEDVRKSVGYAMESLRLHVASRNDVILPVVPEWME
eukprot:TRINITY_DN22320_c0_g1_i1.p1 TRINITY_DN22320_c0_g1~~TRINITY_DN22320_c0_g1_i1.p1  ORF type:complete len:233 (+),score=54.20 TRINITY_DN22320_c0_g1_i1:65-763(+)